MLQSKLFTRTKKQIPSEAEFISHKLLLKADYIDQLTSGVFSFLPLGFRVLKKIENIIREEIETIGGQEIMTPMMQSKTLWEETGRWKTIDPPLFKFKDRHGKEMALGSTHEEIVHDLVRRRITSYRDLPIALFQIQNKFRNEMRSQGGLLRVREFMMKDLYSFHANEEDLKKYYEKAITAYKKIYNSCGIDARPAEASGGTIGGKTTNEFMALSDVGEDKILICEKCSFAANMEIGSKYTECPKCHGKLMIKNGIEIGHIFQLGTQYSKKMKVEFINEKGKKQMVWAGCYGIGIGRLLATIIEINHDDFGIIWPKEVSPYDAHLICLQTRNEKVRAEAEKLYDALQKNGLSVLYDDRDLGPGQKLKDADLIGISRRVIVSEKTVERGAVEYKERSKKESKLIKMNNIQKLF